MDLATVKLKTDPEVNEKIFVHLSELRKNYRESKDLMVIADQYSSLVLQFTKVK